VRAIACVSRFEGRSYVEICLNKKLRSIFETCKDTSENYVMWSFRLESKHCYGKIDGACSLHGRDDEGRQNFGRKIFLKETIWKILA
jgi:hypothetical protein